MKKRNYLWLALLLAGTVWVLVRHNRPTDPYHREGGLVFGTVYNLTYQHPTSLKEDIEREMRRIDGSLSMFNDTSTISRVNRNELTQVGGDTLFCRVFRRAMEVSELTDGRFDITVAPLVNAWGFGFKQGEMPGAAAVRQLLKVTGWRKIRLTPEGEVVKDDPRVMLDCSAIAKGYAVDRVADLLRGRGVKNFMVEIGGEVVAEGVNPKQAPWRVGVNRPADDPMSANSDLQTILELSGKAIATSGNYRRFYLRDGKKYAHTINPRTGYPVEHSLLSATVVAPDCMTADAYATSFMVMGLEEAMEFAGRQSEVEAYFIYAGKQGEYLTAATPGLERMEAPAQPQR